MSFWSDKRVCVTGGAGFLGSFDVTRAKEYFGFEAQMQFDEGIKRTVEWWEANREGYDERRVG